MRPLPYRIGWGTYTNCLVIKEWNLLEPGVVEHKIFAPNVGLVKVEAIEGESGHEDLIDIITP